MTSQEIESQPTLFVSEDPEKSCAINAAIFRARKSIAELNAQLVNENDPKARREIKRRIRLAELDIKKLIVDLPKEHLNELVAIEQVMDWLKNYSAKYAKERDAFIRAVVAERGAMDSIRWLGWDVIFAEEKMRLAEHILETLMELKPLTFRDVQTDVEGIREELKRRIVDDAGREGGSTSIFSNAASAAELAARSEFVRQDLGTWSVIYQFVRQLKAEGRWIE